MTDKVIPVILSGGSGTRLWPLSRRAYPKQFLTLVGKHSLLQQTCLRLADPLFAEPVIIGNHSHRFLIAEQVLEVGTAPQNIVLEPCARNTAPAVAIAALLAMKQHQDALVVLLPSDHIIEDSSAFAAAVQRGSGAARDGALVTFAVTPEAPNPAYGYIEIGARDDDTWAVRRFVEKPSVEVARDFIDTDRYFWNAGIFLATARSLLAQFEKHTPALLVACEKALADSVTDLDFLRLDEAAYGGVPDVSFDYAIMEKADNIRCVPLETPWRDLGAWPAVWDLMAKDADGNARHGDVVLHSSRNCFAYSENTCLSLLGLEDLLVVATADAILVAAKDKAHEVREIVKQLEQAGRPEVEQHTRVYRPWGWYERLNAGPGYQVKCLMVKPGAQLSLQSHLHRSEHWVVVDGSLEVTLGEETRVLNQNQSTYIPTGIRHRLANPGTAPAYLIEVQSGSYLGEDDIKRYEDDYLRAQEDG